MEDSATRTPARTRRPRTKTRRQTPALKQLPLPELAVHRILGYMDIYTLKQLRLVSKEFKEWVEVPKYLEKFKIYIKNEQDLNKWLRSSVPFWNNFVIRTSFTRAFATRFGPHLKHLRVESYIPAYHFEFLLSSLSPNIETLDFGGHRLGLFVDELPSEETRRKWRQNLVNLKEFTIGSLVTFGPLPPDISDMENKSFIFDMILNSCSQSLTRLTLPPTFHRELTPVDLDETQKAKMWRKVILEPVSTFLRRFSDNSSKLVIDFGEGIAKYPTSLNADDLMSLARDCSRSGARLLNVPMQVLPTQWNSADQQILGKSVLSVTASHSEHLMAYVPPTSKVRVLIVDPSHFSSGQLPTPVHRLEINILTVQNLNPDLFRNHRTTMEEFMLKMLPVSSQDDASFATDICQNFPNLHKLKLCMWGYDDDYNVLIRGLPLLTHLSFYGCISLTDWGIIGPDPDNPLILQLTNLTHLEMSRTDVTNWSFTLAFRHMKLKTFIWIDQSSANVTFEDGISTLATIDGGFKDYIEILEISKPPNTPKATLETFISTSFRNIQHFKIHKL